MLSAKRGIIFIYNNDTNPRISGKHNIFLCGTDYDKQNGRHEEKEQINREGRGLTEEILFFNIAENSDNLFVVYH